MGLARSVRLRPRNPSFAGGRASCPPSLRLESDVSEARRIRSPPRDAPAGVPVPLPRNRTSRTWTMGGTGGFGIRTETRRSAPVWAPPGEISRAAEARRRSALRTPDWDRPARARTVRFHDYRIDVVRSSLLVARSWSGGRGGGPIPPLLATTYQGTVGESLGRLSSVQSEPRP